MEEATEKVSPILDDRPTDKDALDFSPYRDTLVDIIADPATRTPLTIGIFGGWGSGKTSLMQMVESELKAVLAQRQEEARTVWFNAWQYGKEEALWRALLLHVLDALRPTKPKGATDEELQGLAAALQDPPDLSEELKAWRDLNRKLDDLQASLYRDVEREEVGGLEIDWGEVAKGTAKGVIKIGLSFIPGVDTVAKLVEAAQKKAGETAADSIIEAFRREKTQIHIEHIRFLEQFRDQFEALVEEQVTEQGQKLVVFVDDLDRCLPEKAIDVLEAIKLFLDVSGCIFVLGLDQEVVARGIKVKYRDFAVEESGEGESQIPIDGVAYLQKIIQLPFLLPPIESEDMESFVETLVPTFPDPCCVPVFAKGLREPNPRQVKRVINVFLFLWRLAAKRESLDVTAGRLSKVIVIQHTHPKLYEVLKEQPGLLAELEEYFREETRRVGVAGEGEDLMGRRRAMEGEGEQRPLVHPRLADFVQRGSLRKLLTLHPAEAEDVNFVGLTPSELRPYFTLTRRAAPEAPAVEAPREVFEPQMVRVPAGEFQMGTSDEEIQWLVENTDWAKEWQEKGYLNREQPQHSVDLSAFEIGRYPVMNSEYRAFVLDTGHRPPSHWEEDTYPNGLGDHPVVNVSWHDAAAYCQWLSEVTGRSYRLPTEAEWEKAAGWDEKAGKRWRYPWGDDFDPGKCNTREGGPGKATPAGQYSRAGDSPYGATDMAGNVWEWTSTKWGADWEKPEYGYPYRPDDGREQREVTEFRVLRGGSWYDHQRSARCAYRIRYDPGYRDYFIGFRVAASPGSP
jgi:formylglycine-generating enzyme required for sulfatase activity/Cdc6-like AAA superfamily ATPase